MKTAFMHLYCLWNRNVTESSLYMSIYKAVKISMPTPNGHNTQRIVRNLD